jgi:hypothetical protein
MEEKSVVGNRIRAAGDFPRVTGSNIHALALVIEGRSEVRVGYVEFVRELIRMAYAFAKSLSAHPGFGSGEVRRS